MLHAHWVVGAPGIDTRRLLCMHAQASTADWAQTPFSAAPGAMPASCRLAKRRSDTYPGRVQADSGQSHGPGRHHPLVHVAAGSPGGPVPSPVIFGQVPTLEPHSCSAAAAQPAAKLPASSHCAVVEQR